MGGSLASDRGSEESLTSATRVAMEGDRPEKQIHPGMEAKGGGN